MMKMIPREHIQEDLKRQQHHHSSNNNNNKALFNDIDFPSLEESSQRNSKTKMKKSSSTNSLTSTTSTSTSNSNSTSPSSTRNLIASYIDISDDNTDGWKKRDLLYYCFIQRHHEVHQIAEFVESIANIYKTPTQNLLDLGCGIGRMFSEWEASKWSYIDAYEPDADYYQFSLDHASHTCDKVKVHNAGFLDLKEQNKYNMIACVHGPFQYLTSLDHRLIALRNMYLALAPGGVVMIDVSNFLGGLTHFRPHFEQKMLVNGVPVKRISNTQVDLHNAIWSHEDIFFSVDGGESDVDGLGVGYGDGSYITETHKFSIFTLSELQLLLLSSGFININSASKYSIESIQNISNPNDGPRIIVTGQKPR